MIPGFEPSPDDYAPSLQVFDLACHALSEIGATNPAALDRWSALLTALISQQVSNDPGRDRWRRLHDDAVDTFTGAYM